MKKNKFKERSRNKDYKKTIKLRRKYLRNIRVNEEDKYDLIDDLLYNKDIDSDIYFLSENFAFWSKMAEVALERYSNFEIKLKIWEAKKSEYYRNKLTQKGGRVTVDRVENAVKMDPKYIKMYKKLHSLYKRYGILKNCARDAVRIKKEMLQTKSANEREQSIKRLIKGYKPQEDENE